MIPIAEASLAIPDSYKGITVLALGGMVMVALTAGVVLAGFQRLRTALTAEMKRELDATAKALEVKVQSPLVVQQHKDFVTLEDHEAAILQLQESHNKTIQGVTTANEKTFSEIKAELGRHAHRRSEIYDEQKAMKVQIAEVKTKTDLTHAQVQNIDSKMDRVLQALPRRHSS